MEIYGKNIVERLDNLLYYRHLKRKAVCDFAGISVQTITDWDKRNSIPAADSLYKIAIYLETTVEYLLTGKDPAGLRQDERELLNAFNNLNGEGKRAATSAVIGLSVAFPLEQVGALSGTGA